MAKPRVLQRKVCDNHPATCHPARDGSLRERSRHYEKHAFFIGVGCFSDRLGIPHSSYKAARKDRTCYLATAACHPATYHPAGEEGRDENAPGSTESIFFHWFASFFWQAGHPTSKGVPPSDDRVPPGDVTPGE